MGVARAVLQCLELSKERGVDIRPQRSLQLINRGDLLPFEKTSQVVGFITAISDGVLSAYIPLLEVLPSFQGQGIGKHLVERMLEQLESLYMVDLLCDESVQPFYAQFQLHEAKGMMRRNYARQDGG